VKVCVFSSLDISNLNDKLNPMCHLLALLRAHPILHVSRVKVNMFSLPNVTSFPLNGRTLFQILYSSKNMFLS